MALADCDKFLSVPRSFFFFIKYILCKFERNTDVCVKTR